MKKVLLLSILLLCITPLIFAQDGNVRDRANDAFRELNSGQLTLRFVNALNGEFVTGASVSIAEESYTTDFEGKVTFKTDIINGQIPVTFNKEGFISSEFELDIMVGTLFQNRVSVSPDMRPESIRIVLDWSEKPRDLDAHLIKENGYHISYRNKRSSEDGVAQLDRDDTNGNGPETITINKINQGEVYTYKVQNYSNKGDRRSTALANMSRAVVRVYGDGRLLGVYRLENNRRGTEWTVFNIENGRLIRVDTLE